MSEEQNTPDPRASATAWRPAIYRLFTDEADALAHAARLCRAGYRVSIRHPHQDKYLSKPVIWAEAPCLPRMGS